MYLDELVNRYYDSLNDSDLYIWEYVSRNRYECSKLTIDELAKRCNASKTSIMRFSKKISLSGFSELKLYLKMDADKKKPKQEDFLELLCSNYITSIGKLQEMNMDSAFDLIYNAKRVFLFGTGHSQNNAANELHRMFFNARILSYVFDANIDIEDIMDNINSKDVMILISLNGESDFVVKLAKRLKMKNIKSISITKAKNNTLASLSTENIYFSSVNFDLFDENNTTFELTTMFFLLCELFYVKYQIYKKKKDAEFKKGGEYHS